jgi:8-oxo-dGTP diphosphatase
MQYNFCSHCGTPLTPGAPFAPQQCTNCGTWHYHNSKPCAGALVLQDNRVLLAKRAIEPFKGYWDIPGGFLEPGEHPEAGAKRELLEETGLQIRLTGLLGIYMDEYGAANYYTLNMYYLAEIVSGTPHATDDVAELEWFSLDDLPTQFAFAHEHQVMTDLKLAIEFVST